MARQNEGCVDGLGSRSEGDMIRDVVAPQPPILVCLRDGRIHGYGDVVSSVADESGRAKWAVRVDEESTEIGQHLEENEYLHAN